MQLICDRKCDDYFISLVLAILLPFKLHALLLGKVHIRIELQKKNKKKNKTEDELTIV